MSTQTSIKNKIIRLRAKIASADEKIKKLDEVKAECEKEIVALQEEEILICVREMKLSVQEVTDRLELGAIIQKAGLTRLDVEDLIGTGTDTSSATELNFGRNTENKSINLNLGGIGNV